MTRHLIPKLPHVMALFRHPDHLVTARNKGTDANIFSQLAASRCLRGYVAQRTLGDRLQCGSDGAAVAIPLDVAFSLRLVSVLRRQRAGLASAAAVMIGVKAMANMARVDPILTRSGHSSRYAIDIAPKRTCSLSSGGGTI
jgi:hypothetical protein